MVFTTCKILIVAKLGIRQTQGLILLHTCIDKIKCLISLTSEKLLLFYFDIKGKRTAITQMGRICIDNWQIKELNSAGQSYLTKMKIGITVIGKVLRFCFLSQPEFWSSAKLLISTDGTAVTKPALLLGIWANLCSGHNSSVPWEQRYCCVTACSDANYNLHPFTIQQLVANLVFSRSRTRMENISTTAEFCQEMPLTKHKIFCPTFLSLFLSEIHT